MPATTSFAVELPFLISSFTSDQARAALPLISYTWMASNDVSFIESLAPKHLPNKQGFTNQGDDPACDATCCYQTTYRMARELASKLHKDAVSGDLEIDYSQVADDLLCDADITTPHLQSASVSSFVRIRDAVRAPPTGVASQLAYSHVEPSYEPCCDEIPWSELAFWLDDGTGQVECSCGSCVAQRNHSSYPLVGPELHTHTPASVPSSVHQRLSAKIPVIAMPRIEGIN